MQLSTKIILLQVFFIIPVMANLPITIQDQINTTIKDEFAFLQSRIDQIELIKDLELIDTIHSSNSSIKKNRSKSSIFKFKNVKARTWNRSR